MKNKLGVILLTLVIGIASLYYLSFSFVANHVQKKAEKFATEENGNINFVKKQKYLDSVWKEPVYPVLGHTYEEVKKNALALGLDLQGGMYLVLEVSPVEIIKAMASSRSTDKDLQAALKKATAMQKESQEKYVTLFGRAFKQIAPDKKLRTIFLNTANKDKITNESSDSDVLNVLDNEIEDAIDRAFQIIRKRVDKFGVTNPNLQKLPGSGRIQVELPEETNPERARKLLSGVAKLEFWEVWQLQELGSYLGEFVEYLEKAEGSTDSTDAELFKAEVDTTQTNLNDNPFASNDSTEVNPDSLGTDSSKASIDSTQTPQTSVFQKLFKTSGRDLYVAPEDTARVNEILNRKEVKALFPGNLKFLWGVKAESEQIPIDNKMVDNPFAGLFQLYAIKTGRGGKAPLEGDVITNAYQDFDRNGAPSVSMRMNAGGARTWGKLTRDNTNRQIAIVLDNFVYSAPNVQGEITGGVSQISGSFTIDEAKDLANVLKAGKLPAPTRIVEEAVVGPSLGKESIRQGVVSMIAGIILVILFMVLYYSSSGMVANLALIVNVIFILGILATLGAALTLPGIAGIVLTIGMSVDANVLIFERIREEIRNEMPIKAAIAAGFSKAYSSIIDANVTTFLTGVILYVFGAGTVQGFAVVLMIGIACSFFSAVFITRLIIESLSKNKNKIKVKFFTPFTRNIKQGKTFNFIRKRKIAYAFSSVFIIIGIVSILAQGGLNLGVDFKGGRSYVIEFKDAVPASDVRSAVVDNFNNTGTEVKTFGANNKVKITTSYLIDDESEESDKKVKDALMKGLSKFEQLAPELISSTKVGATIADDIRQASQTAIIFSLIAIFIYILIRFRKWQYSLGALVALFHDVLIVLSTFSIARWLGVAFEIDQVFIAAMLTIIGYSINDTVVVFDRIREFVGGNTSNAQLAETLNYSINKTLSRTIITAVTTFIVVLILFIFGGEVLRGFSFALLIGVIFGTYSSIFIASPIVLDLAVKKKK